MRKFMITFFVLTLMIAGISVIAYAGDCMKETPMDQAGDWFATMGKKGMEKDQILAKRRSDRMIACAKKFTGDAAKEAQKAGNDMKRKLGF